MDEGILSLKWNNHNSTFIHSLSTLHKMEMYSDVTLACEGKYFSVHKLVLSICSEYFEEILSRTKCQHPVVVLKDIKHNDLEALLNYMYAGEANVAQSELSNLIKAAECLRIKGLAVPDETPPTREKRRHIESSELCNSKKRRNDDISSSNNQILKEFDSSENSRLSDSSKNKKGQENSSILLVENQSERQNSSGPIHDRGNGKKIPEIVLEGQSIEVKQEVAEPKIEEHDESHTHLEETNLDLGYSMNIGEEESNESDRHGQDSQTSHILQDLMSHSVPGPSGVHGHDSISNWESSNNLSGYSVENYSSDEGRNQQMDAVVLGRGSSNPQQQQQQQQQVLECPYCPRAFLYRSDLTRHLRSHTGEKPFTCPFCAYRGTQKTHLHEHIKRKHKALITDHHDSIGIPSTILHLPLMRDEVLRPPSPVSPSNEQTHSRHTSNAGTIS